MKSLKNILRDALFYTNKSKGQWVMGNSRDCKSLGCCSLILIYRGDRLNQWHWVQKNSVDVNVDAEHGDGIKKVWWKAGDGSSREKNSRSTVDDKLKE